MGQTRGVGKGKLFVPSFRFDDFYLIFFLLFYFNPRLGDVCVIQSKHSGWICGICCLIGGM
jgi:hypothetical protein